MRNTRVIIHESRFIRNLGLIQEMVPGTPLCLAVKANAYGHGAVECARLAKQAGVLALGVSCLGEGIELRQGGITGPVLMYGLPLKGDEEALVLNGIEPFCATHAQLDAFAAAARTLGIPAKIHLKVDTGMGRIGCSPAQAEDLAAHIRSLAPHIEFQGLCTHFPVSDMDSGGYTSKQIEEFTGLARRIRSGGPGPVMVHASNTGGLVNFPAADFDMVRPGIIAYGYPGKDLASGKRADLARQARPVMELRSTISFVKEVDAGKGISYGLRWKTPTPRWIGTITSGYADGLPRLASSRLVIASLDGRHAWPQAGTICMDQCMIDLGPSRDQQGALLPCPASPGEEVVIFGGQPGSMDAQDLADLVPTIPYEILCGINQRIPREFTD